MSESPRPFDLQGDPDVSRSAGDSQGLDSWRVVDAAHVESPGWHTAEYAGDSYPGETPQAQNDAAQSLDQQTPIDPAHATENYSWALSGSSLNISDSEADPKSLFDEMAHHDFTKAYAYGRLELTGNWDAVWQVQFSNMALHLVEKDLKKACKSEGWSYVTLTGQDGMPFDGESVKTSSETGNQKARRIESLGPNPEYNEDADSRYLANGYRSMQHGQAGVNWVGKAMMNCWQDRDISQPHYAEDRCEHHAIYDQQGHPVAAFTGKPHRKYNDQTGNYERQGRQYGDLLGERNKVIPIDHPIGEAFRSFLEQQPDGTLGEQLHWENGDPTLHQWVTNSTGLDKIRPREATGGWRTSEAVGFDSSGDLNWHIDPNQWGDMGAYDNAADNTDPEGPDESDPNGPVECSDCGKHCANYYQWLDHIQHSHGASAKDPRGIKDILPDDITADWSERQLDYAQSSLHEAMGMWPDLSAESSIRVFRGVSLRGDSYNAAYSLDHDGADDVWFILQQQSRKFEQGRGGLHWSTDYAVAQRFAEQRGDDNWEFEEDDRTEKQKVNIVIRGLVEPQHVHGPDDPALEGVEEDRSSLGIEGEESELPIQNNAPITVVGFDVQIPYMWGDGWQYFPLRTPEEWEDHYPGQPTRVTVGHRTSAKTHAPDSPIPFLYDIAQDRIYVGKPGQRHSDIQHSRLSVDVAEGVVDPKLNLQIRTQSTMPYSTSHLIQLWYAMQPEYPIKAVYLLSGEERIRLAGANGELPDGLRIEETVEPQEAMVESQPDPDDWSDYNEDFVPGESYPQTVDSTTYTAYANDTKVGYLFVKDEDGEAVPGQVWVDSAYRRRGIGEALWAAANKAHGGLLQHSRALTDDGEAWAQHVGNRTVTAAVSNNAVWDCLNTLHGKAEVYAAVHDPSQMQIDGLDMDEAYLLLKQAGFSVESEDDRLIVDRSDDRCSISEMREARYTFQEPLVNLRSGELSGDSGDLEAGLIRAEHADPIETLYTAAITGFDVDPSIRLSSAVELDEAQFGLILAAVMEAPHPSKAIRFAFEHNLFDRHLPELARMRGFDQRNRYHGETLENHTLSNLSVVETLTDDPLVRLASLFHDVGKPDSIWIADDGYAHYYEAKDGKGQDHEKVGGYLTRACMARLGFDEEDTEWTAHLVNSHMFAAFTSEKSARKFLCSYGDEFADALLIMRQGDQAGKPKLANDSAQDISQMRQLVKQARISGATFDLQELQGNFKHTNILDPIHETVPAQVFGNPKDPAPLVKPEINEWIHETVYKAFTDHGWDNPGQWIEMVLTGSLTTLQYSDESDIDISLFIDWENRDEDRAELVGIVVDHLDGLKPPGCPFPLQCFVVNEGTTREMLFAPGLRSAFDLETNTWLVPPDPSHAHDVYQEWPAMIWHAKLTAQKLEMLLKYDADAAKDFWDQVHGLRRKDQIAGKGDYSQSNIDFKWIIHEGMAPEIEAVTGERLASMRRTADWGSVASKAQRLIQTGRVHIIHNQPKYVSGIVRGDHGTYNCEISRDDPSSNARTQWMCGCKWHDFAFDRTRQWKKYEGRPCLLADAMISMADGTFKPIIDVEVGDQVVTHDGIGRVSETMVRDYHGDMVTLTAFGGLDLTLTPNHEMYAQQMPDRFLKSWNGSADQGFKVWDEAYLTAEPAWIDASDLRVHDSLVSIVRDETNPLSLNVAEFLDRDTIVDGGMVYCTHQKMNRGSLRTTKLQGSMPDEMVIDESLAYLMGVYMAEGNVARTPAGKTCRIEFTIHKDESDFLDRIVAAIESTGSEAKVYAYESYRNSVSIRATSHVLASLFEKLLPGLASSKTLHPFLMFQPPHIQAELVRGWSEGDGNHTWVDRRDGIRTSSRAAALQLVELLRRIGEIPSLRSEVNNGGPQSRETKGVIFSVKWVPEKTKASGRRWSHDGGSVFSKIRQITTSHYHGPVYNLAVDSQESYVANGWVTHNCSHVTALQWLGRSTLWDEGSYEQGQKPAPGQRMRPMDQAEQETRYKNYDEDLLDHITEPQADEGDLPRTFTPQSDPNAPQEPEPIAQPTEQPEFDQMSQGQPVPDQLSLFQQPQQNPFLPSMQQVDPSVRKRQQDQLKRKKVPQRDQLTLFNVNPPTGFYTSSVDQWYDDGMPPVHISGSWDFLDDITNSVSGGNDFEQWLQSEGFPEATPVIQLKNAAFLEQRMGKIPMPGAEPVGYTSEGVEQYNWRDLGYNPATDRRENADEGPNGAPERRGQMSEAPIGTQGIVRNYDALDHRVFIQIPLNESGKLHPALLEGWVAEADVIPVPGAPTPFRPRL